MDVGKFTKDRTQIMSKRVIVIEDNPDNAEIARIALEACGIDVLIKNDGISGLEAIRKSPPDAVILDIMIPKMNGYEVCTTLQKDDKLKNIPIMIMTAITHGNKPHQDSEWCAKMEVEEYVSKPFDTTDFTRRVLGMLGVES